MMGMVLVIKYNVGKISKAALVTHFTIEGVLIVIAL